MFSKSMQLSLGHFLECKMTAGRSENVFAFGLMAVAILRPRKEVPQIDPLYISPSVLTVRSSHRNVVVITT
jgi:hypothetical protein